MPSHRYFCEHIEPGPCRISAEESHHAASVLRVRPGEKVELFDGRGGVADATVTRATRKAVSVQVATKRPCIRPPEPFVTMHVAVPKGARQHVLIEKCTELGVTSIQPFSAERSVVKPAASIVSRWRRYAIEACKQSRQAWLPVIEPPVAFTWSIQAEPSNQSEQLHPSTLKLIGAPGPNAIELRAALRKGFAASGPTHVGVWIGPEGGFTAEETQEAQAAGLQCVSLGDSVLRVETAAIAVLAAIRLLRGCP